MRLRDKIVLVMLTVSCILVWAWPMPAQEATPTVSEPVHFHLLYLQERAAHLQSQYDLGLQRAITQYRERPETRQIIADAEQVNKDAVTLIDQAFTEHGVDKTKFKLDLETGQFIAPSDVSATR